MTAFSSTGAHDHQPADSVMARLQLCFAILTVLGGMILAVGHDQTAIPVIAIFFAIVGYLLVDLLKVMALPPNAAHLAMAVAAVFCVADFANYRSAAGARQLLAVAHLLVLVQAILMMQVKNKRVFEQLVIFCLLELIVAAVFNDAISFGLLLVPIGIVGALALGLLAVLATVDNSTSVAAVRQPVGAGRPSRVGVGVQGIRTTASGGDPQHLAIANQYVGSAVLMLVPSVLIVALVFFYALPRTSDAARPQRRDTALVGFSDRLRLQQMGQMLRDPEPALQVRIRNRLTGQPYRVTGGIYFRGRVLEHYRVVGAGGSVTAEWNAVPLGPISGSGALPPEYIPTRWTDTNFYDSTTVSIRCQAMRSPTLFAVAPYYRTEFDPDIAHASDRWTIARRVAGDWNRPPIEYAFGTHAFHRGIQSRLIARWSSGEWAMLPESHTRQSTDRGDHGETGLPPASDSYIASLLSFNRRTMPTIAQVGQQLVADARADDSSNYEIAKLLEAHFAGSGRYQYTLNLRFDPVPGMDPIEQFVAVDRQGHCQYFASALAMMLRSQNIPARVVVGYFTDEYSEWSNEYTARQLHAHAWVEALMARSDVRGQPDTYGQPDSEQYWMRLDPTPASHATANQAGVIRQSLDLAQDLWNEHVVELDADRQQETLFSGGIRPDNPWYENAIEWTTRTILRIQSGDLGRGSLAGGELFSWTAALVAVGGGLLVAVCLRWSVPRRLRRLTRNHQPPASARPGIEFYAAALDQLARLGVERKPWQTPAEFAVEASATLRSSKVPPIDGPLERLTANFYGLRFGGRPPYERAALAAGVRDDLAVIESSVEMMLAANSQLESTE